ncbi:MAG: hypothetical protein LBQ43_04705 [Holosporales bacterium]|jgi:hypothetical protein|nr:hypothetical protein [Holosporales bacterium]
MAVQGMRTISLPGRSRFKIPVVGTAKNNALSGISKATREWSIRIDDIFKRTAEGVKKASSPLGFIPMLIDMAEDFLFGADDDSDASKPEATAKSGGSSIYRTELFGFTYDTLRETVGHSVNQLIASASIRHSDVVIIIQNGTYSPILEQYMNDGTLIKKMVIYRSGFIEGKRRLLEKRTFKDCYVTQFKQILDFLVLHVRVLYREETSYIYAQHGLTSTEETDEDGETTVKRQALGKSVSEVDFRTGFSSQKYKKY